MARTCANRPAKHIFISQPRPTGLRVNLFVQRPEREPEGVIDFIENYRWPNLLRTMEACSISGRVSIESASGRVRFIDSPLPSPSMVDHGRYETSSTRMHPRSENQSGIPIPDRRPPLYLLVIELVDTHPRAVDELSILQVLPRYLQRRRLS